jgi:hypothetical protein
MLQRLDQRTNPTVSYARRGCSSAIVAQLLANTALPAANLFLALLSVANASKAKFVPLELQQTI